MNADKERSRTLRMVWFMFCVSSILAAWHAWPASDVALVWGVIGGWWMGKRITDGKFTGESSK